MTFKLPPEACLTITLDRKTYHQGDIISITIKNGSNETQCFGNAAYDLCFERFSRGCWEFYDAIPGAEVITCLKPGQTGQVTWKLGGHTDRPFPAGHYRVGTKGVYAEFEVTDDELSQAELEEVVIDFLKTTDVPIGVWDGTVKVKEIYDHKLGGKVIVVKYATATGGHPDFFLDAFEHHIAVITLNIGREVVSAFCVSGSFHDGKIWDLLNQRWIQQDIISEQQAIHIGRDFLDGIGYMTGKVLSTKLEEKTPNFYWHDLAEIDKPDIHGLSLCWIIRFEQKYRPGHFFEAWIDAYSGEVMGGTQCR